MQFILDFEEIDKSSLNVVGGKNANLGEMIKAGMNVPPGFAITTHSYLSFITEAGLKRKIYKILSNLDPSDVQTLNTASSEVRELIDAASMSADIRSAIGRAYSQFCCKYGSEMIPVAVRSSATAEDLPTASFAGQQDTYLGVKGSDQVIESVQKCWGSLFTPRAISYRIKNEFPHDKVLISVGVQKLIDSKAAGVMFTLNPTNGDPSKVVIEGNWGLGETVVSGEVNPDRFVIDKVIMEINEITTSAKHIECIYDYERGEVVNAEMEAGRQCKCCLDDQELRELVRLSKAIERHYRCPQDIEWAIDRNLPFPDNIFIVQSRPETIWSQKKPEPKLKGMTGRWGEIVFNTLVKSHAPDPD